MRHLNQLGIDHLICLRQNTDQLFSLRKKGRGEEGREEGRKEKKGGREGGRLVKDEREERKKEDKYEGGVWKRREDKSGGKRGGRNRGRRKVE